MLQIRPGALQRVRSFAGERSVGAPWQRRPRVGETVMRRLVKPSALVEAYFDNLSPPQQVAVRALRDLVLAAVPELEQTVLWGDLAFMVQGRNLLSIGAHKSHAALQLSNGALLTTAFPELEGSGRGMRLLKLRYGHALDAERVQAMVRASYQLARSASA